MKERVPSFVLLVPGPWERASEVISALRAADISAHARGDGGEAGEVEVELVEDPELAAGFQYGRDGRLADDLLQRIEDCSGAAIVDVPVRLDRDPARAAAIGRALQAAGGVAVRMELSGAASSWERWLEKLDSGSMGLVYECAVVMVGDDEGLFTCGMHHFDRPDAEIGGSNTREAIEWLDAFHLYQLVEDPVLVSGQTFRPDTSAPRRVFERWPDGRHHSRDGRHNPFGIWRFLDESAKPRPVPELALAIIPPLAALLAAQERALGRALSRSEVEELVAKAPAMAVTHQAVTEVERKRGYADIDPELAYEQWQIVRSNL